jgi:hypothetical protein
MRIQRFRGLDVEATESIRSLFRRKTRVLGTRERVNRCDHTFPLRSLKFLENHHGAYIV